MVGLLNADLKRLLIQGKLIDNNEKRLTQNVDFTEIIQCPGCSIDFLFQLLKSYGI
jgi:hypothetical protein